MSEPEVGTKAPENDAAEDVQSPPAAADHGTKAQEGPSMGEHCISDRPVPDGRTSSGEITKFSEIEAYVSKPADYPNTPGKLLILLTGGTGIHSTNNQIQADMFAQQGYVVVMPDQFSGDPAPNTVAEEEVNPSLLEQIKMGIASTAKSFLIDMWLARHTPEKVLPIIQKVLDVVKNEYADSVAYGGGIYAVGYCFGARYVVMLAGRQLDSVPHDESTTDEEQAREATTPAIKAGAIAHATSVTKDELKAVKAPLSMICVENDPLFPEEVLESGKQSLASASIDHEITTFPGVPHGFAIVGDYDSALIRESQAKAFKQMLEWLAAH